MHSALHNWFDQEIAGWGGGGGVLLPNFLISVFHLIALSLHISSWGMVPLVCSSFCSNWCCCFFLLTHSTYKIIIVLNICFKKYVKKWFFWKYMCVGGGGGGSGGCVNGHILWFWMQVERQQIFKAQLTLTVISSILALSLVLYFIIRFD